jgi:hypothetical protein
MSVLETRLPWLENLLQLLGSLRPGDSLVLYVEFPGYRLKKRWVSPAVGRR